MQETQEQELQPVESSARKLEPARGLILLVEDDPAAREGLEETLRTWGYEVVALGSAEEAEFAIRTKRPDFAIVDVFLPGRSGRTLMTKLREKFPDAVLVGISGLGDATMSRSMKGVGADAFVDKPIRLEVLAEALKGGHKSWH